MPGCSSACKGHSATFWHDDGFRDHPESGCWLNKDELIKDVPRKDENPPIESLVIADVPTAKVAVKREQLARKDPGLLFWLRVVRKVGTR